MRILIIEDETKVANALREGLETEHYDVTIAATGEEGFFLASQRSFDLLLLDLMLPRRDGIDVLATLRKCGNQTPILVVTAKDAVEDRVIGLDQGADDYLTKPFAFSELLARIRALLRRGRMDQILKLQHEDLEMDLVTHKVSRGAQPLDLTTKEFDLLEYLMRHSGHVVSREMLARDVWHAAARATPLDNVIDVTIARLRRKVDERHERNARPFINILANRGLPRRHELSAPLSDVPGDRRAALERLRGRADVLHLSPMMSHSLTAPWARR